MGRPHKYSSVSREGIGTSTVVRVKGEGGGGADRDGRQDHRGESRASKILLAWVVVALRWYGENALRTSRSSGGNRLLRPSTHTRAK